VEIGINISENIEAEGNHPFSFFILFFCHSACPVRASGDAGSPWRGIYFAGSLDLFDKISIAKN